MRAVAHFGRLASLCAIELFERIGDPRASDVLIPMLGDDDDTVREWAARALGELGVREAVPALRRAYEAVKARATPLDWTEPEGIRSALTALGARTPVTPVRVEELQRRDRTLERCWAAQDLPEVISALANAGQVVLYFMYWERWRDTHVGRATPSWDIDWSLPWSELAESARKAALDAAHASGTPPETFATASWIDKSDR